MKIVVALFHVLFAGYVNCSVSHKDIVHNKNDRKHVAKIVHAILQRHKSGDLQINQARQKAIKKDIYFSWYEDFAAKLVYVDMWLAYDLMNSKTQKKERVEEFLQDSCFTKEDMRKLKICTFYKKRLKSKP